MNEIPILSVTKLSTAFRVEGHWKSVVRDISFDIKPRETLAVVGESGSGKSVTALSIMRLTPPSSSRIEGSIKLSGTELMDLSEAQMRRVRGNEIAMIFQEPMTSLNPVPTIGSQIAETLILHRDLSRSAAEAETLRLLDKVRIPAAKSRLQEYPHRFSGGMRQRICIARARSNRG
jgi:peptide/nickel transport system ATP-binding protein